MNYPTPSSSQAPIQSANAKQLRRRNWLYIYLPISFAAFIALVVIILLSISLLTDSIERGADWHSTASGIADIMMIFTTIPLLLLCLLGPLAVFGSLYGMSQNGYAPTHSIQKLLWRIQGYNQRLSTYVQSGSPRVAKPIITFNSRFAYLRSFLRSVAKFFTRS